MAFKAEHVHHHDGCTSEAQKIVSNSTFYWRITKINYLWSDLISFKDMFLRMWLQWLYSVCLNMDLFSSICLFKQVMNFFCVELFISCQSCSFSVSLTNSHFTCHILQTVFLTKYTYGHQIHKRSCENRNFFRGVICPFLLSSFYLCWFSLNKYSLKWGLILLINVCYKIDVASCQVIFHKIFFELWPIVLQVKFKKIFFFF